jgi:hypothetical protein
MQYPTAGRNRLRVVVPATRSQLPDRGDSNAVRAVILPVLGGAYSIPGHYTERSYDGIQAKTINNQPWRGMPSVRHTCPERNARGGVSLVRQTMNRIEPCMARKPTNRYAQRDQTLRSMGYMTYADYLASRQWRWIRGRVLERAKGICEACRDAPATQIHHRSYSRATLRGRRLDFLVACCHRCHESAEFDGKRKTGSYEANVRMAKSAWQSGIVLPGICPICRRRPLGKKKSKKICNGCKRGHKPFGGSRG